jgi:chemotaxis protein methyltransferase CheR
MKNEIKDIAAFVFQTYRTDISIYEDDFLIKSLDKRLISTRKYSYNEYLEYLKVTKSETDLFLDSLHVAFSEFFRNPLTFSVIEQILLPSIIEKKKSRKEKDIRIWSAACAAGQEAYSLAIIFDEAMENSKIDIACRIFATDINQVELSNARKGIYQAVSIGKVCLRRLQKYFVQQFDNYIISPGLRHYIDFSVFDFITQQGDSPPSSVYGNFDIIFCSNVLFYYKPEVRLRILEKLSNSLAPGGCLITSETERDIVKGADFRELFINSAIFQKIKQ